MPFYNDIESFDRLCISLSEYADRPDIEIVIVDDCSEPPQSLKLKKQCVQLNWPNLRVIHCVINGGAAKARRLGIEAACGEYIAFLDSDDGWAKSKLDAQLACMQSVNAVISGNPCLQIDIDDFAQAREQRIERYDVKSISSISAMFNNPFSTPTVMVRRDIALNNPFDDDLRYAEDADCWCRILLRHGGVLLYGANAFMFKHAYLSEGSSLSSNTWKMSKGQFQSLLKLSLNRDVAIRHRLFVPFALMWSALKAIRREVIKLKR